MPPFWVQLCFFHSSRFYCLTFGIKKKTEGRRDIKGEKEGVEQERRKERRKTEKIIRDYSKKKLKNKTKQACWLQTGEASFVGLFVCSQRRWPSQALLHPDQHWGSLQPSSAAAWTHRFRHSPSCGLWVCTRGLH